VRKDGSREWLPSKCDRIKVREGDILYFNTWGGGGWGDPLKRPAERVAADVERGLVTVEGARAYGVVVSSDFSVDVPATEALRNTMAAERPPIQLFNRGGTLEEIKARCKAETSFDPPRSPVFANWMRSPAAL
jgi:N-methylhydantoinase B